MERAGDELLAGAGLAVDEDGGGGGRGLLDEPVDLLHRRAAPDHGTTDTTGGSTHDGRSLSKKHRRLPGERPSLTECESGPPESGFTVPAARRLAQWTLVHSGRRPLGGGWTKVQ